MQPMCIWSNETETMIARNRDGVIYRDSNDFGISNIKAVTLDFQYSVSDTRVYTV